MIVLNGGSRSGKSTLARALQVEVPGIWLRLSVDTLIEAAPPRLFEEGGLHLGDDGSVEVGPVCVEAEAQWRQAVAAFTRAGGHVIVEDNFVSGPLTQGAWQAALHDVATYRVGSGATPMWRRVVRQPAATVRPGWRPPRRPRRADGSNCFQQVTFGVGESRDGYTQSFDSLRVELVHGAGLVGLKARREVVSEAIHA